LCDALAIVNLLFALFHDLLKIDAVVDIIPRNGFRKISNDLLECLFDCHRH